MWTDPTGLTRDGERLETFETTHPTAGKAVATLYRTPGDERIGRLEQIHLELYVGGKTHERIMPSLSVGHAHMTKFRGN